MQLAPLARALGIARSLVIYHAIPGRHRRMARFYAQFLGSGDLGFDVGAHVGSRVRSWRRLDARVIAVEPQSDCLRLLRLLFGRDDKVEIVSAAVGAEAGTATLSVSSRTPTVSSLSPQWIREVAADRRFARVRWDVGVPVPVTTLDALIDRYGQPAFCKIDVEGSEDAVLAGLSQPLAALSFEYLPAAHDDALKALARLRGARRLQLQLLPHRDHALCQPDWLDDTGLLRLLDTVRPSGRSGDVYARLVSAA